MKNVEVAVVGYAVISKFGNDLEGVKCIYEGHEQHEPFEFDIKNFVDIKGVRAYPRGTQLAIAAASEALKCARSNCYKKLDDIAPERIGLVTASTFTHMPTAIQYDLDLTNKGTNKTNPTLFPLALPSSPGALTALALKAKAFSITVNNGGSAGLEAVATGARMLKQNRADLVVVVASWAACEQVSSVEDDLAVALVLKRADDDETWPEIRGYGSAGTSGDDDDLSAQSRAVERALRQSDFTYETIDHVSGTWTFKGRIGPAYDVCGLMALLHSMYFVHGHRVRLVTSTSQEGVASALVVVARY